MKNYKKNLQFISLTKLFDSIKPAGNMISLDNSFELSVLFRKLGWRLISASFTKKVKVPVRMHQLSIFARMLYKMTKHHGATTTVAYLKACQLAVEKRVANDRIKSLRDLVPDLPLPRLSKSGLPRFIPLRDRRAIMGSSPTIIRWYLTMFSVYRVISIPGKLKLQTITDPYTGTLEGLERVSNECEAIASSLKGRFSKLKGTFCEYLFLETSSPTQKSSWMGLIRDPFLLKKAGLMEPIRALFAEYGADDMDLLFRACLSVATNETLDNLNNFSVKNESLSVMSGIELPLIVSISKIMNIDPDKEVSKYLQTRVGQLSTKQEAAGKVRLFALVDVWTQSALKPLHSALFAFLRSLPNDGTFDQRESVKRAARKALAANCSFGYDLTAATDRLPISIQKRILSMIYSPIIGESWSTLLVNRDYHLSYTDPKTKEIIEDSFRYKVGQPMGALSSWAMLAITHHFLVQAAALRAGLISKISKGRDWYDNYELLGDDIVIFDENVAKHYLTIMADIGVPINLSKSVVAKNASLEFAKVFMHLGKDVSAISWKMFMSQSTMMGRANIAYSLLGRELGANKLISWLDSFTAWKRGVQGDTRYTYFALLAMAVNSRLLDINTLLFSAIPNGIDRYSTAYVRLLGDLNPERLRDMLIKVFSNKSNVPLAPKGQADEPKIQLTEKQLSNLTFKKVLSAFEQLLREKAMNYLASLSLDRESKRIAIDMMKAVAPSGPKQSFRYWSTDIQKYGVDFRAHNIIYSYLDKILRKKLFIFPMPPMSKPPGSALLTEWLTVNEDIDRNLELRDIVVRAATKQKDSASAVEFKESPLSSLTLLSRAGRRSLRLAVTGAFLLNRYEKRRWERIGKLPRQASFIEPKKDQI